jgi:hypothetical protein
LKTLTIFARCGDIFIYEQQKQGIISCQTKQIISLKNLLKLSTEEYAPFVQQILKDNTDIAKLFKKAFGHQIINQFLKNDQLYHQLLIDNLTKQEGFFQSLTTKNAQSHFGNDEIATNFLKCFNTKNDLKEFLKVYILHSSKSFDNLTYQGPITLKNLNMNSLEFLYYVLRHSQKSDGFKIIENALQIFMSYIKFIGTLNYPEYTFKNEKNLLIEILQNPKIKIEITNSLCGEAKNPFAILDGIIMGNANTANIELYNQELFNEMTKLAGDIE